MKLIAFIDDKAEQLRIDKKSYFLILYLVRGYSAYALKQNPYLLLRHYGSPDSLVYKFDEFKDLVPSFIANQKKFPKVDNKTRNCCIYWHYRDLKDDAKTAQKVIIENPIALFGLSDNSLKMVITKQSKTHDKHACSVCQSKVVKPTPKDDISKNTTDNGSQYRISTSIALDKALSKINLINNKDSIDELMVI